MPDSLNVIIPDPKTDMHIGDLNLLHIIVQNIDQNDITLKELVCMPDAGIKYCKPDKISTTETVEIHEICGTVWSKLWTGQRSTAITTIGMDKPIHPGNDESLVFPFIAGGVFRRIMDAGKYTIVFVIKYEKGGMKYTKVVQKDISIYNHLSSMILGGIVGGIIGVLFRDWDKLSTYTLTNWVFEIFFGILVGFIVIIILQRKSNVQAFVSINDAWGGLLAGFIAGAAGRELIASYLSVNPSATAGNVTASASSVTTSI